LNCIVEKDKCVGCSACVAICPSHCISMVEDKEGFRYPVASDKCIQCKQCEKVCPINNKVAAIQRIKQKTYSGATKDFDIWKRSTSGGAFSEICKAWGDSNTIYFGAKWDGFLVKHDYMLGYNNIAPLCKSKYISSDMGDSFSKVKKFVERGNKVVFCGTPCQIAGLRNYLKKEYDNLLLIDFVCHGVGSPKVFKTCIQAIETQFGNKVHKYEFRSKKKVYETDYLSKITLNDDSEKYLIQDQYIQLFLKQRCLRLSCGKNCKFRNINRQGDITIADFKGLGQIMPSLAGEKRNFSTIVINTEKGAMVLNKLKETMDLYPCDIKDIEKFNPLIYKQTWFAEDRDDFFQDYILNPKGAIEKWTTPAIIYSPGVLHRIYGLMPVWLRRKTLQIYKRIK